MTVSVKSLDSSVVREEHRSQEGHVYHETDMRLRANKFSIYARPNKGPVRWTRGGKIFLEEAALKLCQENK